MASSGSLSGISFSGLGSGIDSESIVQRLMALERQPILRLQQQQAEVKARQTAFSQFRTVLQGLATAASSLNTASSFNPISANSSTTATATLSASNEAIAGVYRLEVSRLAQAHKVATAAQASVSEPLGQSGSFLINGKAIQVEAADTLTSVAQKINGAGVGVTASLINGGPGSAFLSLTANATGAAAKITLADFSGSVLGNLGLVSGAATAREPITNGVTSRAFTSASTPLSQSLGLGDGEHSGSIVVNGVSVGLKLGVDSLQGVADKINAAATGATATVRTVIEDGTTTYKLDLTGAGAAPTLGDPDNVLAALGVFQRGYGNQLLAAQDASFKLDGISLTSKTNVVTTAIPGATLTLLKGNETTPETSTLSLTRDDDTIKRRVKDVVDAYNKAMDFVRNNSKLDKDTFDSGLLFGDPTVQQIESRLSTLLFNNVEGLTGDLRNLASIGLGFDNDGKLTLDDAQLSAAIAKDVNALGNLFRIRGDGSVTGLNFVSATDKSVASGSLRYNVEITALATKGAYTGEMAQTGPSTISEKLTFTGSMFGSTGYSITLNPGSTAADTVQRINNDAKLKDLVQASLDVDGKLKIESKRFGTGGNFTVVSDHTADVTNSGIGVGSLGVKFTGTDIQGLINGEVATGNGQFLTGNSGNAKTDGLQIQYTGTATGVVGTIGFTKGMASQLGETLASFTDTVNGLLTATDKSYSSQMEDLTQGIKDLNDRASLREQMLRERFLRMEQSITAMQQQAQRLAAMGQQQAK